MYADVLASVLECSQCYPDHDAVISRLGATI